MEQTFNRLKHGSARLARWLGIVRAAQDERAVETREELSERWMDELLELIEQGDISPAIARRIRDDQFEPTADGSPPLLRASVWQAYLAERAALRRLRDR